MLSASIRLIAAVAAPRMSTSTGLPWLWQRFLAPLLERTAALRDACALREHADALACDDPRLASDLRAAADRHEQQHGD